MKVGRRKSKDSGGPGKKKKLMTLGVAMLFILTGVFLLFTGFELGDDDGYETGKATLKDLLASQSTRSGDLNGSLLASSHDRNDALIATPVALYYDGSDAVERPLLVADDGAPSRAVSDFIYYYGDSNVVVVGEVDNLKPYGVNAVMTFDEGSAASRSLAVAREFWADTDGALLVNEGNSGYGAALNIVPLACYLNIPVIVTDKVDSGLAGALDDLGVKYTLVAGPMKGYGKVMHFDRPGSSMDRAAEVTAQVVTQRLGLEVDYVTLANPGDTLKAEVIDEVSYTFDGTLANSDAAAYPGAAPTTGVGTEMVYFDIPEDYTYANVILDGRLDISEEEWGDTGGARLYTYMGVDGNMDGVIEKGQEGDALHSFMCSLAFENEGYNPSGGPTAKSQWGHLYTEVPMFNQRDKDGAKIVTHACELMARLPTDWGNVKPLAEPGDYEASYKLNITVQKLSGPIYPTMFGLSTMAPYLTAHHAGVLLADPRFQIYDGNFTANHCYGVPSANLDLLDDINDQATYVKYRLNDVLAMLAGMELGTDSYDRPEDEDVVALAGHYASQDVYSRLHLAIMADPNMVPHFYYDSGQAESFQGYGMPSDIFFQDIDADPYDAPYELVDGADPSFEIPAGRVDGWDAQDVSAVVARTVFYYDIIDAIRGPRNNGVELSDAWADSAMTSLGQEPPVECGTTACHKLDEMFEGAGFDVKGDTFIMMDESRRQRAGPFYESSNLIFFNAHGNFYWYVPPAWEGDSVVPRQVLLPPVGAGGAFDVAHVKEMRFGPSVIWGSSCVTGKIDGIQAYNALSQAFMHAGTACYIGATRMSWGSLLPIPDAASGERLGNLLGLRFFGHLTGTLYDKDGGLSGFSPEDTTVGMALMLAKNFYVEDQGSDAGGVNDDTTAEFIIHGDPAFNPYEPNHEGRR